MGDIPAPLAYSSAGRIARWSALILTIVALVAWATGRMTPPKQSARVMDASTLRGVPLMTDKPATSNEPASADATLASTGSSTGAESGSTGADAANEGALASADASEDADAPAEDGSSAATAAFLAQIKKDLPPEMRKPDVPPAPPAQEGYKSVGFLELSNYEYLLQDRIEGEAPPPDQIPAAIRALDKQAVAITGFMMPIEIDNRRVRSFLLVKSQLLCCFGVPPKMNEWIYCEMRMGKMAEYVQDVPTIVTGELHVGEELQDGYVMSIYRMYVDRVAHAGGY